MKKTKITAAVLSLAILTACNSGQIPQTSETVSESEASAVTTTSATTTETKTETVPETEPAEIAEEKEYVQVSANNEFIDFEFIENYQGTTDIGDLANKAVEFLKATEYYSDSMKNISEFSDEEFSDYIADGVIVPKFNIAYPNDYDGDGREETFIILKMPSIANEKSIVRDFIIFADSGENMKIIDHTLYIDLVSFLNYGRDKQIIFVGHGGFGAEELTGLYGVKHGDIVTHYSGRISFYKSDCFLSAFGWQGGGDFMYYDTAKQEYRSIMGEVLTIDEMKAIDKENFFAEYYEAAENDGFAAFLLIGGKYYCLIQYPVMDVGTIYTCEDGKFTLLENSHVRVSLNENNLPMVKDIDINKAIAEMKPPSEPYVEVSPDNEFIDYEFIEGYQGTTDIGDLADKAVEFLKTTEYYSDSMENIERINTDELKRDWDAVAGEFYQRDVSMYFNDDGSIQPVFSTAYPADYDGDGKTETFIVVDMPFMPMTTPDIWGFLLFADSSGNIYPDVLDYYRPYSADLLNYGKFRHLGFGGASLFRTYSSIYGVKDDKPVTLYDHAAGGYFCKTDCFLTAFGLQGGSDFMYFDTVALEYRIIKGVKLSHAEMAALDVSNTLCSDLGAENIDELPDFVEFYFIKPNYYLLDWRLTTGSVLFAYENGIFTRVENTNITRSTNGSDLDAIAEFDIDRAIAEMKKPQK